MCKLVATGIAEAQREANRMSDLISRQGLLNKICDGCGYIGYCHPDRKKCIEYERVESMPSVEPEQRWIPVGERLPEDSQFVLMTIRRMGERYNHEPFISIGYISWNQSVWWCAHDGDCKSHNVRVDAWMSLPKLYSERRQDE